MNSCIMQEQFKCPVCLSIYSEPKHLQCNHVFCQKCLWSVVAYDWPNNLSLNRRSQLRSDCITCPICYQPTPTPAKGVAGLPYHIPTMLGIIRELKDGTAYFCPGHKEREAELYCETCEQLICYKCVAKGSDHHSHEYREQQVGDCNTALPQGQSGVEPPESVPLPDTHSEDTAMEGSQAKRVCRVSLFVGECFDSGQSTSAMNDGVLSNTVAQSRQGQFNITCQPATIQQLHITMQVGWSLEAQD